MKRTNVGRGIISVKDFVRIEFESLMKYLDLSKETLLVSLKNEGILKAEMKKEKQR